MAMQSSRMLFLNMAGFQQPCRNFATLKDIAIRLKSVKNIQKITKSMKMVAAAKFARAERELRQARPFGVGAKAFYSKLELAAEPSKQHEVVFVVSSDRGLCGAVHSNVVKSVRNDIAKKPEGTETKLVVIGDKAKGVLQRTHKKNFLLTFADVGKKPVVFADAGKIALAVLQSGFNFSSGVIKYNRFKTIVSYETTSQPVLSLQAIKDANNITLYDSVDDDALRMYNEYTLANLLFYAMKEGVTSEQSSRMTAMDSASKNAGEMITKLTLTYNRTRQAVITRELIEIISGAAAV